MASMMGSNYLPTEYQSFIHMSRYSRWLEEEGRRETWTETVGRLIVYFKNQIAGKGFYPLTQTTLKFIYY